MAQHPPSFAKPTDRAAHLETLRALACIALVSYHVTGATPRTGMELPLDHWLAQLNGTFIDMRMPLFSFLSGCVFISLERLTRSPAQMLLSKTRRLLVPMFSVGLLFWTANMMMGRAHPPVLDLLFLPYAHFWFLQATFLIMVCFLLLYAVLPGRSTVLAAALMVFGALAWLIGPRPPTNVFSVIQAAYLMPFFMLGYLCTHSRLLTRLQTVVSPMAALALLIALIGLGYALAAGYINIADQVDRRALTLIIGATFCLSLLILSPRNAVLARFGSYSYTIYLFHVFFTAGSFEVLGALMPHSPDVLVWIVGIGAGILGPIALHQALMRQTLLSALFLGLKLTGLPHRQPAVAHSSAAQRA